MKIVEMHSHLNGKEFLMVHQKKMFAEIQKVIESVDATNLRTKESKEKTMSGRLLYNPVALNEEFRKYFRELGWGETRYSYCVTTDREIMEKIINLPLEEQKKFLVSAGKKPLVSFNQTDFVKNKVAIEVQFGKYPFVAYDLFVKHLMFFSGGVIDVGIEILPMKSMQNEMSTGIAYYEGEVYKVLRQGRGSPHVPLLIIGVAP